MREKFLGHGLQRNEMNVKEGHMKGEESWGAPSTLAPRSLARYIDGSSRRPCFKKAIHIIVRQFSYSTSLNRGDIFVLSLSKQQEKALSTV